MFVVVGETGKINVSSFGDSWNVRAAGGGYVGDFQAIIFGRELYIAGGGIVENDPNFPGHWFNTGIIINPKGEVILKYRKCVHRRNIIWQKKHGLIVS